MAQPGDQILVGDGRHRRIVTLGHAWPSTGEGQVFRLVNEPGIVKLYRTPTVERAEKLQAMLTRPCPMEGTDVVAIWPQELAYAVQGSASVIGFGMELAGGAESVYSLMMPHRRPRWATDAKLLQFAACMARRMAIIHAAGYVVADVHDRNVVSAGRQNRQPVFIDADSFQFRVGSRVFRCEVGQVEYRPPEFQLPQSRTLEHTVASDCFGLGVLIFRLLADGLHPFSAIYQGVGHRAGMQERIAQGIWPYGARCPREYQPKPECPSLDWMPPPVVELFRRCFEDGHADPAARPTPGEWEAALTDAAKDAGRWRKARPRPQAVHVYQQAGRGQSWLGIPRGWFRGRGNRQGRTVRRSQRKRVTLKTVLAVIILSLLLGPTIRDQVEREWERMVTAVFYGGDYLEWEVEWTFQRLRRGLGGD